MNELDIQNIITDDNGEWVVTRECLNDALFGEDWNPVYFRAPFDHCPHGSPFRIVGVLRVTLGEVCTVSGNTLPDDADSEEARWEVMVEYKNGSRQTYFVRVV